MTFQVCTTCVMDTSDPAITFDEAGVCIHCQDAIPEIKKIQLTPEESRHQLKVLADRIKENSKDCAYDAVVGMSGGVDSSYVAWLAKEMGLRVLAVHFDNGWNAEIAVANIESVVTTCGFDLETYVIDWPEFKDLQRSFIKAGVVDIEMLSDHAIMAAMFDLAKRHKVKYVLSGTNIATEHGMPRAWVWNKQDLTNIQDIQKRFGSRKIKSFPTMGLIKSIIKRYLGLGFKFVEILDKTNFRKNDTMALLEEKTGWQYYGGKHYESVFTKFYQAYILPEKFGIDKRKVHLSALIRNGEISREEAVAELNQPLYDPEELRRDKEYVLKKLSFDEQEFNALMKQAPVAHDFYKSDLNTRIFLKNLARKFGL